jgi:hypothetical protein
VNEQTPDQEICLRCNGPIEIVGKSNLGGDLIRCGCCAPGDSSGQAPSEPRRWVLDTCSVCGALMRNGHCPSGTDARGLTQSHRSSYHTVRVTVQEVRSEPSVEQGRGCYVCGLPQSKHEGGIECKGFTEVQVEAGARALAQNDAVFEAAKNPENHLSRASVEGFMDEARAVLRAAAAVEGGSSNG